jgi:hypothetical protein
VGILTAVFEAVSINSALEDVEDLMDDLQQALDGT